MTQNTIRVLIADDSPLAREAIKSILESDPSIDVIATAKDGKEAIQKTLLLKPNVITMDLNMPVMSGIEAIEQIMQSQPTAIIIVSSMDVKVIIKALSCGAMDFVAITGEIDNIAKELIYKVKIASRVRPLRRFKVRPAPEVKHATKKAAFNVVAIGVSTGGPQALQVVLSKLPPDFPAGILVVQHMSKGFIEGLAEWLSFYSSLDIKVAKAGDILKSSTVFFAPDDYNIKINEDGQISLLEDVGKQMLHVPSIDEMMKSVAASYRNDAIGVIMTGMGKDGVHGIKAIKDAGGTTIAQDSATSVIFGMNKVAVELGYIDRVVGLDKLADELVDLVR